nr:substrate-binding domain-containing protein [Alicyclobacillus mali (ex Roth et al. 2021)]
MVTNSTGAIGILIPPSAEEFFVNPFFAEWMAGVAEVARQRGVDTVLSTSARGEIEMLDHMIRGRRVDGVLLIGTRRGDPVLKEISKLRCPAVLLGRPADPAHVSWVNNDNQRAAYDATLHLLNLGHRRIGFLGGASDLVVTMDRVAGYRNALVDYGVEPDPRLEVSSFFLEQGGYLGMMRLLAFSDRPTAVLCADDVLAFGGMRAAHELGFEVPRDLAIVGFNDIRLAELAHPALTSVRVHMHELGVRSAGLLLEEIDQGKPLQRHVIVNHELVIRYSCGAKPIGTLTT